MNTPRNTTQIGLAFVALVLVAIAGFFLGRMTGPDGTAPSSHDTMTSMPEAVAEREVLFWRAPMDPNEIYDAPGQSRMGMDLVPVYADEAKGGEGVVSIDPVTLQNIGVRTAQVVVEPLERTVRTTGRFAVNEQRTAVVSAKVGGWVEALQVDFTGARVASGQPLLDLYSPELVSTQEEYLLAIRHAERLGGDPDGQRLVEAARRRLSYWDITEAQIQRLAETGAPTKTLTLYAPSGGTVAALHVAEGEQIRAGQTLMELADLGTLWLMVDVYEQDLAWVAVGTRARIELPYDPGRRLTGRVSYLYDDLDPATRTVRARVEVSNPGHKLKPGMYATVHLFGAPTEPTPVVPAEAVLYTGDRAVVIVALGDGRFRPVDVRTGLQAEDRVQILEGLMGHEAVVTSAQFLIDSEARLAGAVRAMTNVPAAPPASTDAPGPTPMPPAPKPTHPPETEHADHGAMPVLEIAITDAGFTPDRLPLAAGVTTRLVFTRHSDQTCATTVQIPTLGIEATPLPLHQPVAIDVTLANAGSFTFACGMNMLRGTLLITP